MSGCNDYSGHSDCSSSPGSAELILLMTFLIMAAVVGFAVVKDAVATELNDVSNAIGTFDQSFTVSGLQAPTGEGDDHATCSGFGFTDSSDICDGQTITIAGGGGGEGGAAVGGFGGASASAAGGGGGGGGGAAAAAAGVAAAQAVAVSAPAVQATETLVPVVVESVEQTNQVRQSASAAEAKDCCPCPPKTGTNATQNAPPEPTEQARPTE